MIEKNLITKYWSTKENNSLEEVIKLKNNSSFRFFIKKEEKSSFLCNIFYNKLDSNYRVFIIEEKTKQKIIESQYQIKTQVFYGVRESLNVLGFKSTLESEDNWSVTEFVDLEEVNFEKYDSEKDFSEKINNISSSEKENKLKLDLVIKGYQKSKVLSPEDISFLLEKNIINGIGGRGGINFGKLLRGGINKLLFGNKFLLRKVDLLENAAYYHDLDFYIGGGKNEFIKSNLDFVNRIKTIFNNNLLNLAIFYSINFFGIKYFSWVK